MSAHFGWQDWTLVLCLFALTTWIGHRMAGRPATMREFFLGGRRLPWYAVAGSIIATEISAVTLISLPSTIFRDGGNLTYLQLGLIGSLVARGCVALWIVPAYYEREIYSPYDFMGARLGPGVRRTTTVLFSIGGILGQASRVYLTAVVLEVILLEELDQIASALGCSTTLLSVSAIGLVSVGWTLAGGIATVIWTDVVLFAVFLCSIVVALVYAVGGVDGGFFGDGGVVDVAREAGKLRLLDFQTRLSADYTFWAALFAQGLGGLGAYGTDQLMAQRIFCCANKREAQKAVLASYGAMAVTVGVGAIGLALYAYYQQHGLSAEQRAFYDAKNDRIFPIFISSVVDSPFKGLIVAGVFAAAISSLDSILAALSQTTLSAFHAPRTDLDAAAAERRTLLLSRVYVVVFGLLLCAVALQCERLVERYGSILNLALAMPLYTQGAVLGAFVLAFFSKRVRGDGYTFAAMLAVLSIVCLAWRQDLAFRIECAGAAAILAAWFASGRARLERGALWRTLTLAAALAGCLALRQVAPPISWVWYALIGASIAAGFGWLLDSRARAEVAAVR